MLYGNEEPWTALMLELVMSQDRKSYYHVGSDGLYFINYDLAQDKCNHVGIGWVCTLPEITTGQDNNDEDDSNGVQRRGQ